MAKWRRFYRVSITRRFMSMLIFTIMLILLGSILMVWGSSRLLSDYEASTREMKTKQELVSDIALHTNDIILRARGYYVYLTDFEYEQIFEQKEALEKSIAEFKQLGLTTSELEIIQAIEAFFDTYFSSTLPVAVEYAKSGNYEALRSLISADASNPVNELISYANDFEAYLRKAEQEKNTQLVRDFARQGILFILYVGLILVISLFIVRRMSVDLGGPLSNLSLAASRFARGDHAHFDYQEREDEIGRLARSLETMMITLHSKEEELVAQNEELLAQQDELQMQQEELEHALGKMSENERFLQKRNLLVQSLANTLNKQELLDSIITNLVKLTGSDKGMIILTGNGGDYSAYGLSDKAAEHFANHYGESLMARAIQKRNLYIHEREATDAERAYHLDGIKVTDTYVPVLGDNDEIIACLLLTKIGRELSDQEQEEISGLATQISLALAKLGIYEESEYQRQINHDMLNTIQEAVQLVDTNGLTLHVNRMWYEMFDLKTCVEYGGRMELADFNELLQKKVAEPQALIQFIKQVVKGEVAGVTSMNYELHEPVKRYVQIYYEPLYRGSELFGVLLVHRDITKEYEVDRMKSEFVSTVSHELRTPLASVLGFAELLLHRELKPDRQRKYISTIHQEARRLTTLINDFLDLQRMESGRQSYDMKPAKLGELVQEAMELQKVNVSSHNLIWKDEAREAIVFADRDKMLQVFTNLINNAIKYSPHGGKITIHLRTEKGRLLVTTQDEGLGIPADALPNLFNKFYRVDNSDRREIGGTGLGLAIVKEIINRHKGDISVHSVLGEGSAFTISLPLFEPQEQGGEEQSYPSPSDTGAADIMLIENDRNLAVMLREELEGNGYRVHLFTEGSTAVHAMKSISPKVVVVDLMLETEFDGWAVIEQMRSEDKLNQIPIVISSAFEEQDRAAKMGIRHFLIKPYEPHKLTVIIQTILNQEPAV
ncbi:histidine kinase [Paenibacillus sambharensis]|uniref:histidine kinase n=1 Tax=Paenibacillus sambharensis TaxID=1803190 RepID=A0A2W1LD99_9BACL|nr:ATP-binding protein [Paenibacillus sambharensis]PZD97066.1 histidine kinase [Paenibacillus sambharensis]